ncbi:MAG: hypothetical protein AAGA92_12445 [Planctomycetota bacterium]
MTRYSTAVKRSALAGLLCYVFAGACAGQEDPVGTEADGFAAVLEAGGLYLELLSEETDGRVLHRLRGLPPKRLAEWASPLPGDGVFRLGELYRLRGRLMSAIRKPRPGSTTLSQAAPFVCTIALDPSGGVAVVRVPRAPRELSNRTELDEPVDAIGVCVDAGAEDAAARFVALRIAWFPEQGLDSGRLLLAASGFDVGLLEEVRHRRRFVNEAVSLEGQAFRSCLRAVSGIGFESLAAPAQEAVADAAELWRVELDQPGRPGAMAAAVVEAAAEGRSSVAPLFLQPEKETGKLVLLTGLARRAVRIALAPSNRVPLGRGAADPAADGIDGYYEVDLFTPDSQNLPVVCCVPTLPEGFPVGEEIRETVRVPAFFFKSWRYRSRRDPAEDRATQLYAPLVIAPGLAWLKQPAQAGGRGSLAWGAAAAALLGGLWWALAAVAKHDRLQRRRIDALLEQPVPLPTAGEPSADGRRAGDAPRHSGGAPDER